MPRGGKKNDTKKKNKKIAGPTSVVSPKESRSKDTKLPAQTVSHAPCQPSPTRVTPKITKNRAHIFFSRKQNLSPAPVRIQQCTDRQAPSWLVKPGQLRFRFVSKPTGDPAGRTGRPHPPFPNHDQPPILWCLFALGFAVLFRRHPAQPCPLLPHSHLGRVARRCVCDGQPRSG